MLSGTITNCTSNANVGGYTDVGGLMGHAGYGNGKVEMNNNTVGMALSKDETISITATAGAIGAMVGSVNTCSGTGNYYNGQAITAKQGAKELTGYGFGVNQTDNAYIMSATGGLFATMNPGHTGKTMTWSYDLYTKTFTFVGNPDLGYVRVEFYSNFSRFEKMGIVGNNGTGKSTFIKMLLGQVAPDSGKFDIGDTVRFGYFSQEGLHFDDTQKVIDVVKDIAEYIDMGGGKHLTASQFLQHFMFTPEQQHNYVYKLSGGERRKLYLCTVLMKNPNFLVLDEPTNDLDIVTLQILEEYLQDFPGCVIVVSHDRYFMDKVVDHLLVFKGMGDIKDFPGNYTQYREWEKLQPDEPKEAKEQKAEKATKQSANNPQQKRKLTFKEKRELEQLEKDIEALEVEKKQIEEALCGGTTSVEEITTMSKRLPVLNDELDEKSMRWLELSEI